MIESPVTTCLERFHDAAIPLVSTIQKQLSSRFIVYTPHTARQQYPPTVPNLDLSEYRFKTNATYGGNRRRERVRVEGEQRDGSLGLVLKTYTQGMIGRGCGQAEYLSGLRN